MLDATIALLRPGVAFAELSVGDIASEANVSRPTFYAYFRDKRDLVLALGARFEREIREVAGPWLAMNDDDVRAALAGVLGVFRDHHVTLRALVEAAAYDEVVAAFWRTLHERFIDNVVERSMRANSDIAPSAALAGAFALVWMTERAFSEHLNAPRVDDAALLDAVSQLWRSTVEA